MFTRIKKSGKYQYLQIVHNQRIEGHVRQQVIATLGNLQVLKKTGQIDGILTSLAKFSEYTAVLNARKHREIPPALTMKIGPVVVFEKLWKKLELQEIFGELLLKRQFQFSVERAVFLTVLHRLLSPGSDRAAEVWCRKYAIDGIENLELHHLYRAMAWLGEELGTDEQIGSTGFSPRCTKDLIEERLFDRRRTLFSSLNLAFFDTTSIYFEGEGGETLGERGNTKDHRPDLKQMIVGVVLDNDGRPLCCEMWPGNTTDVKTLIPVVRRLKIRFHIHSICIVADRGMISKATISELKKTDLNANYILGARMRAVKEIREKVLADSNPYEMVHGSRIHSKDPSPLKVKEVRIDKRRYIVCFNEDQAKKDRADREAIVASLQEKLKQGEKSLVGNKGYRKYLKPNKEKCFEINDEKICKEEQYDGKWVLQTDMDLSASETALQYKELWMVEAIFRTMKTILETRPVYHKCDETIRGHVFCSYLALVLVKELFIDMEKRGWTGIEWDRLKDDLDDLEEITVQNQGQTFTIRSQTAGNAGKAIQAVRVKLGPTVRVSSTRLLSQNL
jgi:transposase